ncbi:hypothetical protein MMC11_006368 [Xylographa trunciseda]|nr:hypothetical protein [Xylographa trunciseda]
MVNIVCLQEVPSEGWIQDEITKMGEPAVIAAVFEIMDPGVLKLLYLQQKERAAAIEKYLPEILEAGELARDNGVYVNVVHVRKDSDFWKYNDYWTLESMEGDGETVAIPYIGSTLRSFHQRIWKEHEVATFRDKKACFHYRAMDAAGVNQQVIPPGFGHGISRCHKSGI